MKICLAIFFTLLFSAAHSADLTRLTLTNGISETVLPNGLRVVVKEEHSIPLAGFSVTYRAGFRNEDTNGRTGLTHLVEHMMFKGTSNYQKGEIARTLSDVGARFNAYTTWDRTCYWEILPKAGLETAIRLEADRMTNCLFDPAEFELEKKVVLSELSKYDTDPGSKLYREFYRALYGNHPASFLSGTLDDMKKADRDWAFREIYRRYYRPDNAYVIVVGDVQKDEVIALLKKHFGAYVPGPAPAPRPAPPLPVTNGVNITVEGTASENFGRVIFPLPKLDPVNRDSLALQFLAESGALGDFSYESMDEGGSGEVSFTDEPEYPAETVDEGYLRGNFTVFRDTWLSGETMGYDTVQSMMMNLVHWENHGGWRAYMKIAMGMNGLTADDLVSAVRKYLAKTNSSVGFFKAVKRDMRQKPQDLSSTHENFSAGIKAGDYETPTPEALSNAAAVNAAIAGDITGTLSNYFSNVQSRRLSNGVSFIYKPYTQSEKTAVMIGFRGGSASQVKPYQAEFLRKFLFDGGPQYRTLLKLEESGARWWDQGDYNTMVAGVTAASDNFSAALSALRAAVVDRRFMPLVLEEAKDTAIRALEKLPSNPSLDQQASVALDRLAFGGKGEGMDASAAKDDLLGIRLSDIEAFYASLVRPENLVVTVTGKVPFETALSEVEKAFGAWTQSPAAFRAEAAKLPVPAADVEEDVTVAGAKQSVVLMSAPAAPYADPAVYAAFQLGTRIFGGGTLTSRLIRTIRDRDALTYAIFAYPVSHGDQSMLQVYMQNNPADVGRAVELYRAELKRFKESGPTEMEILKFKNELFYSLLFDFEGAQKIASQLLTMQLRRGKPDFMLDFAMILRSLTREQVTDAVRKYMPEHYFRAVAGGER